MLARISAATSAARVVARASHVTAALPTVTLRLAVAVAPPPVAVRSYHKNVIDHYENPRNVGELRRSFCLLAAVATRGNCAQAVARAPGSGCVIQSARSRAGSMICRQPRQERQGCRHRNCWSAGMRRCDEAAGAPHSLMQPAMGSVELSVFAEHCIVVSPLLCPAD
jgi:hypothetical protein